MAGFVKVISSAGTASTGTSFAAPIQQVPSVGNTVIGVFKTGSSNRLTSVGDGGKNTWLIDQSIAQSGPVVAVVRALITTPLTLSDAVTGHFASANDVTAILCEYQGNWSTPDISYNKFTGGNTTTTVTASQAVAFPSELVIAVIGTGSATSQASITASNGTPSSLVVRSQGPAGANFAALADSLSTGILTPSIKWAWTTSGTSDAAILTYVQSGGSTADQGFFPFFR